MQPTSVLWRDLTFVTGAEATHRITSIEGWEGRPPTRYDKQVRTRAHGTQSSPAWADERIVTVQCRCWSEDERDALFDTLDRRFSLDGGEEPLTVSVAGRTLTASAQLLRFAPVMVRGEWGMGRFGWIAEWRCPDPRRYSPTVTSLSTNLQQPGGGIAPPWTPPLVLPARAAGGYLMATNPGGAPTPLLAVMTGPQNRPGVLNATTNQILRYGIDLGTDDVLAIDTERGVAILNGTAIRQPVPGSTITRDFQLPPGTSDLQAIGVGTGVGTPRMDLSFRAASW